MRMIRFIIITCIVLASCQSEKQDALFQILPSSQTGINFSNELPINVDLNIFNYMYYYNGGGLGAGDLNNDGLIDLVFSSNLGKEEIYLNQGSLSFKNISDKVNVDGGPNSWTNGVALADVNGDGLLDIYLSQVGSYRNLDCTNKLFICSGISEEGIPAYEEQSAKYGLDFKGFSTQAGFFDYDLDGDLDMYLMNHSLHHNGTFGQRKDFIGTVDSVSGDRIYRNEGGTFIDVTQQSGIHSTVIGYGLGLAFGDINDDGYPDIYIGNDFHENDYLYINQKDGTFKEQLTEQVKHTSRFSMGVDIADINNDGHQDIISLDMLPEDPIILKRSEGEDARDIFNFKLGYGYNHQYARNALQLNQGDDSFKEIGAYAGIHATDWSWSPLMFDMNMDGSKDLFITNGIPKRMNDIDYINYISGNDLQYKIQFDQVKEADLPALEKIPEIKLKNKVYLNNPSLRFEDLAPKIRGDQRSYSNSAIYADLDNDGDYDIVCNNIDDKAFVYENLSSESKVIQLNIKGSSSNPFGIGTKIVAQYKDRKQFINYSSTKGFQSSMIPQVLLPADELEQVRVIWPDNKTELIDIKSDTNQMNIVYQEGLEEYNYQKEDKPSLFVDITQDQGIDFTHRENPFVEFNREPLIPFSTSSDGPALTVGDVNNDGLEDFFIGSSKRNRNELFIQTQNGFEKSSLQGEVKDSVYEEVDAIFFDIDEDNDQDLIVLVGGNEYRNGSEFTKLLVYENSNGSLIKSDQYLQDIFLTGSCIELLDLNNDNKKDIFLGGRAVPRTYGNKPNSYLLLNKGSGQFEDVTLDYLADTTSLGFVRDAVAADLNNDGMDELIIASEWETIKILQSDNSKYSLVDLSDKKGWWNHVSLQDLDNDGDLDLFCGNLGLNSRLKASMEQPVRMYFNDFDGNGVKEQVLSYYVSDKEIAFSNMMELQKQIPSLKKKYIYAEDFANATITDLLGADKIKEAALFEANHFENIVFENTGSTFEAVELPAETQFTSYYNSYPYDLNADGLMDIVLAGNYYDCNVQMGRYDADNGSVLINRGDNNFEHRSIMGAPLKSVVKQVEKIQLRDGSTAFLFAQNRDQLKLLKLNR